MKSNISSLRKKWTHVQMGYNLVFSVHTREHAGTRHAICVWRNIEVCSCNHSWSGKTISITYSKCVCVALGIQHAMRMRHIAICGLPRCTIFFPHYLINGKIFEKKLLNTKCVFWFSVQLLSETLLIARSNERSLVAFRYSSHNSCQIIMRNEFSQKIWE